MEEQFNRRLMRGHIETETCQRHMWKLNVHTVYFTARNIRSFSQFDLLKFQKFKWDTELPLIHYPSLSLSISWKARWMVGKEIGDSSGRGGFLLLKKCVEATFGNWDFLCCHEIAYNNDKRELCYFTKFSFYFNLINFTGSVI